jgi:hypothetical protein
MDNKSFSLYKQCSSEAFLDARLFVFQLTCAKTMTCWRARICCIHTPNWCDAARFLTPHAKDSRGSVGDIANYK